MKKKMKIILVILSILLLVLAALFIYVIYRTNSASDKKDLEAAIDKQANRFISKGRSYGLVVGVYKNGKTFIRGYGTTGQGKNVLPDSSTVFELASTSKLFTTAVLQILADDGVLRIEDTLQEFLKDKVQLPASSRHTTLQHLATHLSGFPSLPDLFIEKMKDEKNPYKDLTTSDIYDYLKTCDGKKAEGTFEYSNFGMGLLGHLLELKTGLKYEQLVKEKLLDKLSMYSTFIDCDKDKQQHIIQGFDENGNPSPIWTDSVLTGAGSFLSNGSDMIRFIKANLDEYETKVSESLLKTHRRQLNGETGLGWILSSNADRLIGNKTIVWHNGMAGGYASFIAVDRANNFGVIILSNKAVDVTTLGMTLTTTVRTQSWKE